MSRRRRARLFPPPGFGVLRLRRRGGSRGFYPPAASADATAAPPRQWSQGGGGRGKLPPPSHEFRLVRPPWASRSVPACPQVLSLTPPPSTPLFLPARRHRGRHRRTIEAPVRGRGRPRALAPRAPQVSAGASAVGVAFLCLPSPPPCHRGAGAAVPVGRVATTPPTPPAVAEA